MNSELNSSGKYCTKCGNKLQPNSVFCSMCGASQVNSPDISPPAGMLTDKPSMPDYIARPTPSPSRQVPVIDDQYDATGETQFTGTKWVSIRYEYSFYLASPGWVRMSVQDEQDGNADLWLNNSGHDWMLKCMVHQFPAEFEDLYEQIEEIYAGQMQNFKPISKKQTTVDGVRAGIMECEGMFPEADIPVRIRTHIFVKDGNLVELLAYSTPVAFRSLVEEMSDAVNSFRFAPGIMSIAPESTTVDQGKFHVNVPNGTKGKFHVDIPADAQAVLAGAKLWAIWGLIIFAVLVAISLIPGVGSTSITKPLSLVLMVIAGGYCGASVRLGMIAGAVSNGHKAMYWIMWTILFPVSFPVWLFTRIINPNDPRVVSLATKNLFVAIILFLNVFINGVIAFYSFFFAVIAGIPYGLYVYFTKRVEIGIFGYVVCIFIGLIMALLGLLLLFRTIDPRISQQILSDLTAQF